MEVSRSSDFKKLILSGKPTTQECLEAWELIIKENGRHNGNFDYENYLSLFQGYWLLRSEYLHLRAIFTQLAIAIDYELIQEVRQRGYKISTKNSAEYRKSIEKGLRQISNLITKAKMKQSEIERLYGNSKDDERESYVLDDLISELLVQGVSGVDDNITLSRYNAIRKILSKKNSQKQLVE